MQKKDEVREQVARSTINEEAPVRDGTSGFFNSLTGQYKYNLMNPKIYFWYFLVFAASIVLMKVCVLITRLLVIDYSNFVFEDVGYDAVDNPNVIKVTLMSKYKCPMNAIVRNLSIAIFNNGENLVVLKKDEFELEKNGRLGFSGILNIAELHPKEVLAYNCNGNLSVEISSAVTIRFFSFYYTFHFQQKRSVSQQRSKNIYTVYLANISLIGQKQIDFNIINTGQMFAEHINLKLPPVFFDAEIFGKACVISLSPVCVNKGRVSSFVSLSLFFEDILDLTYLFRYTYKLLSNNFELSMDENLRMPLHVKCLKNASDSVFKRFFNRLEVSAHLIQSQLLNMKKTRNLPIFPRFNTTFSTENNKYVMYLELKPCASDNEMNYFHVLYNSNLLPLNVCIEVDIEAKRTNSEDEQKKDDNEKKSGAYDKSAGQDGTNGRVVSEETETHEKQVHQDEKANFKVNEEVNTGNVDSERNIDSNNNSTKKNSESTGQKPSKNAVCVIDVESHLKDADFSEDVHSDLHGKQQAELVENGSKNVHGGYDVKKTRAFFKMRSDVYSWKRLVDCYFSNTVLSIVITFDKRISQKLNFLFSRRYGIFFLDDEPVNTHSKPGSFVKPKVKSTVFEHKIFMSDDKFGNELMVKSASRVTREGSQIISKNIAGVDIVNGKFVKCENDKLKGSQSLLRYNNRALELDLRLGIYGIHILAHNMFCYDGEFLHIIFGGVSTISIVETVLNRDELQFLESWLRFIDLGDGALVDYSYLWEENLGDPFYYDILDRMHVKIYDIGEAIRLKIDMEDECCDRGCELKHIFTMPKPLDLLVGHSVGDIAAKISVGLDGSEVVYNGSRFYVRGQTIDITPDFSNLAFTEAEAFLSVPTDSVYHQIFAPLCERYGHIVLTLDNEFFSQKGEDSLRMKVNLDMTGCMVGLNVAVELPEASVDKLNKVTEKKQPQGLRISWPDIKIMLSYDIPGDKRQIIMILQVCSSYLCLRPFGKTVITSYLCQKTLLSLYLRVFSGWKPTEIDNDGLKMEITRGGKVKEIRTMDMKDYLRKFIDSKDWNTELFFIFQLLDFVVNTKKNDGKENSTNNENIKILCSHSSDYGSFEVELVHEAIINKICGFLGSVGSLNLRSYPQNAIIELKSTKISLFNLAKNGCDIIKVLIQVNHTFSLPIKYNSKSKKSARLRIVVRYEAYTYDYKGEGLVKSNCLFDTSSDISDFFKKSALSSGRYGFGITSCQKKDGVKITFPMPVQITVKEGNWPYFAVAALSSRYHIRLSENSDSTDVVVHIHREPFDVINDNDLVFMGVYSKSGKLRGRPMKAAAKDLCEGSTVANVLYNVLCLTCGNIPTLVVHILKIVLANMRRFSLG